MTGSDPRRPGAAAPAAPEDRAGPDAPVPASAPEACSAGSAAPAPADPADDLPPVDTIGPETDLAPWLRPGVPAALKNAALRRKWLSLPAIRDYVDPALDYAWDWNAAAPVPGAAGRVARAAAEKMVEALTGPRPEAPPEPAERLADRVAEPAPDAGSGDGSLAPHAVAVESPSEPAAAAAVGSDPARPSSAAAPSPVAAPEARRRHGGAAPVPPGSAEGRSA